MTQLLDQRMPRTMLTLAFAVFVRLLPVTAQEPWPAFEEYLSIAQMNAAAELRTRAETWSASADTREKHLSLLALATASIRDEDHQTALGLLDSLYGVLPAPEHAIRATAARLLSTTMTTLGDHERGERLANEGLSALPAKGYLRERLGLMLVQAEALLMQSKFKEASELFSKSVELARPAGLQLAQANAESGLGLVRLNQGRFSEAIDIFKDALALYDLAGSEAGLQNAVANLSIAATMDGRYSLALQLCDSLISALGARSPEMRANLFMEKGVVHEQLGQYDEALTQFQHAMLLRDSVAETISMSILPRHIATTYWNLGRKDEALSTMTDALNIAERRGLMGMQAEIHKILHDWFHSLGRTTAALEHLQAHSFLSDSLNKARFSSELARNEVLFAVAKKDRLIAEHENTLAQAASVRERISMERRALLGAVIVLCLLALLLYRILRIRSRLAKQHKVLVNEQVDRLLSQQELKSINAMLEGQENERDRLGRELHDRLGSMLGGIKANMAALEDRVEAMRQDQQYQKVNRLLDQTVSELRQISHDMAAATLNRFGLEKALKDLRDTLHISGRLHVELNTFGLDQRLERSVEIALYRIVQELVSNVLKHANASELVIAVTRAPGRLSVVVSDNGVGFDAAQQNDGMGLSNVRSRAAALAASVQVDSTPGKGTTVSVECPVVE